EDEAVDRARRSERVEVDDHRAVRGDHRGHVALGRVDGHRRLLVELPLLGARAGGVGGGGRGHGGQPQDSWMVTDRMRCVTAGGMPDVDPCWLIVSTTFMPDVTRPNSGYEFGRLWPWAPATMKN